MVFASRSRRGPDPRLPLKIGIFGLAAVLGLLGIGLESSLLVVSAIVVLLSGAVLRLLDAASRRGGGDEDDEEVKGEGDEGGTPRRG